MQGSEPIGLKSLEHSHVLPLPTRWKDWKETTVVGLHNLVKKKKKHIAIILTNAAIVVMINISYCCCLDNKNKRLWLWCQ